MQILSNLRGFMTVEELIAELKKCNPKATVVGVSSEGLAYYELDGICGKSFADFESKSICSYDKTEDVSLKEAQTVVLT